MVLVASLRGELADVLTLILSIPSSVESPIAATGIVHSTQHRAKKKFALLTDAQIAFIIGAFMY